MVCSLDLIAIRVKAEIDYAEELRRKEEEERLRREEEERERLRREEEHKCWLETIAKDTINFCETIVNDELLAIAKDCKQPFISVNYRVGEIDDENICTLLVHDTDYADGSPSFSPIGGKTINYKIMRDYLSKFCLPLNREEYIYRRWGYGKQDGNLLTITINVKGG